MKADRDIYRDNARLLFGLWRISPDTDFHTLSASQVDEILTSADIAKYRKPKNANGSRARYFYQLLQRRARMTEITRGIPQQNSEMR